jgi:hypothetical protein
MRIQPVTGIGANTRKNATARIFKEWEEAACLEPTEHASIFNDLEEQLVQPEFKSLARAGFSIFFAL